MGVGEADGAEVWMNGANDGDTEGRRLGANDGATVVALLLERTPNIKVGP
jgi:hypothetical protein